MPITLTGVGPKCRMPTALGLFVQHLGRPTTAGHHFCPAGWQKVLRGAYKEAESHSGPPTSSPSHKSSESKALPSPVIPIHPFLSRAQPLCMEHPRKINSLSLPPFSLHLKQLLLVINKNNIIKLTFLFIQNSLNLLYNPSFYFKKTERR